MEAKGSEIMEGGYDLKIVEKDSNLECSICLHLLRDAMGTSCSHVFCHGCIQKLICKDDKLGASFNCPECRKIIGANEIHPNLFADRLVKGSNVYCSQENAGCKWIGTLASFLEKHKTDCNFQIVPCHHAGCKHSGMKRRIKDHESSCKHRIIECKYCQAAVKLDKINEHYLSCERIPTRCPNEECDVIVPSFEVQKHMDQDCKFVLVHCTYAKFGCKKEVLRKDLDKHCERSTKSHMEFICNRLIQSEMEMRDLELENQYMTHKIEEFNTVLQNKVTELDKEISILKKNDSKKPDAASQSSSVPTISQVYSGTTSLIFLLMKGGKVHEDRKDISIEDEYKEWHKNCLKYLVENKLYRPNKSVYIIKIKNEEKKRINWVSNSKHQQDLVSNGINCQCTDDVRYFFKSIDSTLSLHTETLTHFKHKTSQAFMLHPDADKIAEFIPCFGVKGSNSWWSPVPCDDFYVGNYVIMCMVKT